jgi:hypothetical protein
VTRSRIVPGPAPARSPARRAGIRVAIGCVETKSPAVAGLLQVLA